MRTQPKRAVALVIGLASAALLSGCGTQKAGSAAIVGSERLTEAQVASWIDELNELYEESEEGEQAAQPVQRPPADQLGLAVMSWWLNEQVTNELAAREDVSASGSEVDQLLGTDQEQRDAASLQNAIPPSALEAAAEYVVLRRALGAQLAPGATPEEADATYLEELRAVADDLGVSVSPRFGVWNPDIPGLEPRNNSRLSTPVEGEDDTLSQPTSPPAEQ